MGAAVSQDANSVSASVANRIAANRIKSGQIGNSHFFGKKNQVHAFSIGKDTLVAQLKRPSLQIINWADKKDALQSMSLVLSNKDDLEDFTNFLKERYADENVAFYCEVEAYKDRCGNRATKGERALKEQFEEAKVIFDQYVSPGSPQQVNVSAKAVKEIKAQFKMKQATAFVFTKCAGEIVAMMTSDMLRVFTEQQKRRKSLAGAAQLLLQNPELRRQVTFVTGRTPPTAAKNAPPPQLTAQGDVIKRRACDFVSPLDLTKAAKYAARLEKELGELRESGGVIAPKTRTRMERMSKAVSATARAGHEHWRKLWSSDPRNPTGRSLRVKHGENIDVPFEELRAVANISEAFRAAELAVVLVLRSDLTRRQQNEVTHEEWIHANEYSRGSAMDVPFDALVKGQFEMHENWLEAATEELTDAAFWEEDDEEVTSEPFFSEVEGLVVKPIDPKKKGPPVTPGRGPSSSSDVVERRAVTTAVLVVAIAGHRRWRDCWQADRKWNPTGIAECPRNGENLDVPFHDLKQDANKLENLRMARLAIDLTLCSFEDSGDPLTSRMENFHRDWLAHNPNAEASAQRQFLKLPRRYKVLAREWLAAARWGLCLPPPSSSTSSTNEQQQQHHTNHNHHHHKQQHDDNARADGKFFGDGHAEFKSAPEMRAWNTTPLEDYGAKKEEEPEEKQEEKKADDDDAAADAK